MTLDNLLGAPARIHFIGVGGSGIFPLVQIFHGWGHVLQGSDNNTGDTIEAEKQLGVKIFMGHAAENIDGADLIIHSAAISSDNPELAAARERGADSPRGGGREARVRRSGGVLRGYARGACGDG